MATSRLLRMRQGGVVPPAPTVPDFESMGQPMGLQQDTTTQSQPGFISKMFKWLLFAIIPMAVVAIALVFSRLSIILNENGDVDYMKVLLFSSIAGIAGLVVKFYVFR